MSTSMKPEKKKKFTKWSNIRWVKYCKYDEEDFFLLENIK